MGKHEAEPTQASRELEHHGEASVIRKVRHRLEETTRPETPQVHMLRLLEFMEERVRDGFEA